MTLNDPLANIMSNIMNAEKVGKDVCYSKPSSKIISQVLDILKSKHYIGEYKIHKDGKGNIIEISLLGKVNVCGAIKPRYAVKHTDYRKYEKRYLPANGFGVIIVTTSKGIMSHEEAREKKVGGRLIAFCY